MGGDTGCRRFAVGLAFALGVGLSGCGQGTSAEETLGEAEVAASSELTATTAGSDGPASDSPASDGPASEGSASEGSASNGATSNAATSDGAGYDGSAPAGGAAPADGQVDLSTPLTVEDTIEVGGQINRYAFTGGKGEAVSIQITSLDGGCAEIDLWQMNLDLYSADDTRVNGPTGYTGIWGCTGYGPWTLPDDGTYELRFASRDGETGTYTARLAKLTQDTTGVDLSSPVTVEGGFDIALDTDRYEFEARKGDLVSVEVTSLDGGCAEIDYWQMNLELFAADDTRVDGPTGYTGIWGCTGYGPWTVPDDGRYQLRFTGREDDTGVYTAVLALS